MERINIIDCPLGKVGKHLGGYGNIFIIHDRNVGGIVERLGVQAQGIFPIEATEERKTLATVLEIEEWLLEKGTDREAFVLGVGGGITTDLVGFAASVYKRGVRFGFIPTTLLSQVDAAIGGKNGVNLDSYKNIIGVIRQPEMTFICPEPLETLPCPQILSGAAELLKTFIINNEDGEYERAVNMLMNIHGQHMWFHFRQMDPRQYLQDGRMQELVLLSVFRAFGSGDQCSPALTRKEC